MSNYPEASFITSAHRPSQFVADQGAEVAFAGRSNSGKSSAINTIVNRRGFAHTSKTPGRTQLVNFFTLRPEQRLVDLPGYGYARVTRTLKKHWRDLLESYFETRGSLAGLFIIVDIRRSLGDFDRQMLDLCQQIDCDAHILLTKADKLKRGQAANTLLTVKRELADQATVQLFSSLKKEGVPEAKKRLDAMLEAGIVAERAVL
jgi:GTP-binding protein